MSINKPYHRNYRPIVEGFNSGFSGWGYIIDTRYSNQPEHYTRAFLLIQDDLKKMFEYIEPADESLFVYSYRIHELLMRTCIEIEANFKAILRENIYEPYYFKKDNSGVFKLDNDGHKIKKYRKENKWNMSDYMIVNKTHNLSSYTVKIPIWNGESHTFKPFKSWGDDEALEWYQSYNKSKHNRHEDFKYANFRNLLNAVAGLLVLLSSQFGTQSFSPGTTHIGVSQGYNYYKGTFGIGGFFMINFPDNWNDCEKYEFNWSELVKDNNPFDKIDYTSLFEKNLELSD